MNSIIMIFYFNQFSRWCQGFNFGIGIVLAANFTQREFLFIVKDFVPFELFDANEGSPMCSCALRFLITV